MHIFIAQNGTGKTTLLNAITWCLYEKEYQIDESKTPLPILNTAVIQNAELNSEIPVEVKLKIIDGSKSIEFVRAKKVKVVGTEKARNVIENASNFSVTITELKSKKNSKPLTGDDAALVVKQYFDQEIYDFYFFDGENLKNYFQVGKNEKIKSSIYNISQVTLLNQATNRVGALRSDYERKIGRMGNGTLSNLLDQRNVLEKKLEEQNQTWTQANNEIETDSIQLRKLDDDYAKYAPLKNEQKSRKDLENQLEELDDKRKLLGDEQAKFIRDSYINLQFYPIAKRILSYIDEKEKEGKFPPELDWRTIEKLIDSMSDKCPICEQDITGDAKEHAKAHIRQLKEQYDFSIATSQCLVKMQSTLEKIVHDAEDFENAKNRIEEKRINIDNEKKTINEKLDAVNSLISQFGDDISGVNIQQLEEKRSSLRSLIESNKLKKNGAETARQIYVAEMKTVNAQIDKQLEIENTSQKLGEELSVLTELESNYKLIRDDITTSMRKEIQERTEKAFRKMMSKTKTFGRIEIDDSYKVDVYNLYNQKMTGSLSATEQMGLAYAFTLAIHEASGKNCPLVIDSPLGRVSDTNRINMARALFDVSQHKQIIMLFTPDEYSQEVQNVYNKAKVDIRTIKLSADETRVEEGLSK